MKFVPRDSQPQMIDWCLSRPAAGLLAEPGGGKTGVTLMVLDHLMTEGSSRGALICAPIRVCSITWPNQVEKWDHSSWMKVAHLRTPEGMQAWHDGSAHIYLVNPEQLPSYVIKRACPACREKCKPCNGKGTESCQDCGGKGQVKRKKCTTCAGKRSVTCTTCKGKRYNKTIQGECPKCRDKWMVTSRRVGLAEKLFKGKKGIPVDTFVWDELSLAINHSSKAPNSLRPYLPMFKQRIGLTGTPVPNSYMDLFAQSRLLDDGARLGTFFTHFRTRYFEQEPYKEYSYILRPGAKDRIDEKLSDLFLVVDPPGDDRPPCSTEDVEIALPSAALKDYKTLEKELLLELETSSIVTPNAAALATKLRQIVSGSVYDENREVHPIHNEKIEALRKIRKKHPGQSILLLTAFIHETNRILAEFSDAVDFHEKHVPAWQRGEIQLLTSNPKSLSHGIDGLQLGGHIVVWFSPTYSWQDYVQTNKRIDRPGQTTPTIIYRIIGKNTIDEAIVEAVRDKLDGEKGFKAALKNLQQLRRHG